MASDAALGPRLASDAALESAWDRVEERLDALPASLAALGRRFLAAVSEGEDGHRSYFSRPRSPPLLQIPLWLAGRLRREGTFPEDPSGDAVGSILAATMWGYLSIRIQDDLLDEPGATDPELSLFGNVCAMEMHRLFREVLPPSSGFWAGFERAWIEFTAATLEERRQALSSGPYPRQLFEVHARKVAFARVPALAIAALAGRGDLEAPLAELIWRLGIAYGLINDALGWPRDLRSSQRTSLLAAAGWARGEAGGAVESALRGKLYDEGLLRAFLDDAAAWYRVAAALAATLGLVEFGPHAEERLAWIEGQKRIITLIELRRALGRGAGPGGKSTR